LSINIGFQAGVLETIATLDEILHLFLEANKYKVTA